MLASSTTVRWLLVIAILALLVYQERHRVGWHSIGQEIIIVVSAFFLYFGVRGLTEGGVAIATAHAWDIVELEKRTGLWWEPDLQSLIADRQWLVNAVNWVYIWGHWPVIAVTAVWLYLHHPVMYSRTRDAFLVSGAIGLIVFALYPVAPPRLIDIGLMDTVTLHSNAYRYLQPPALVNQYAAMPSLHFGWNLLIGLMIFRCATNVAARIFGLVLPVLMFLAVVLSGNHFILDAVAGGALALGALGVVLWLNRARPATSKDTVSPAAPREVSR
ncbi:MAG: inositol phosphorylceramide synthase [Anaerolinea sp.]|nr:inositol phosphorylceramide synthase [Anaerolinea sp.]